MNNQELFDTVVRHLHAQGRKSQIKGMCVYRGRDNLKCAIGVLIPDDKYSMSLEGLTLRDNVVCEAAGISKHQIELAMDLQALHDQSDTTTEFTYSLRVIAVAYKLIEPDLDWSAVNWH